jgi:hypothetical protein
MMLRQLAAPTLIAIFLALVSIRGHVESNDAFMAFWSRVLANRSAIVVELDPAADGISVAQDGANAAIWLSAVATSFQMPIHVSAARAESDPRICVIRLSEVEHPPPGARFTRIGDATLALTPGHNLLIVGQSSRALVLAVQRISSPETFPPLRNAF